MNNAFIAVANQGHHMLQIQYPVLVVSYSDATRETLVANLDKINVPSAPYPTFCEAENAAIRGPHSGMLVDLPSMIKAKGEEKIVAYTLTNFFPTLRVNPVGSMLIPMTMPGGPKQDGSLADFLQKTCSVFVPRQFRSFARHKLSLSALITKGESAVKSFTLDISWGGAFLVDLEPEKNRCGEEIVIQYPEFNCTVRAEIRRVQLWGERRAAGIGVLFNDFSEPFETMLSSVLKNSRENDRDRKSG